MEQRSNEASVEIRDVLLETYTVNDAMNQFILEHLDPRAWGQSRLAATRAPSLRYSLMCTTFVASG